MSSAIVSPASFDVTKITLNPPKLLPSGAKQAYLNYDGRKLTMQVGSLSVPYGMNMFDKAGPIKYSVDMSLRGYEGENVKAKQVFDSFSALDEYMIEQGVKNSKLWFKADMNKDIIKAFYTPSVRFSKDAEGNPKPYPPTIKVTLKQTDGKFQTAVYDDKKRPLTDIPMEDILVKGAAITTLIECTGVWFAGSKYGLSWKAIQIRVDTLPDQIRGFAFLDDGASAPVPAPVVQHKVVAPVQQKPVNTFQALAEEDDAVDDEEAFSAPAPVASGRSMTGGAQHQQVTMDDEADDVAPVALPKKVITAKAVVKKTVVKK